MNLRKWALVPMFALALVAAGCGPDCESQCEDRNACEGTQAKDCDRYCEGLQEDIENESCEDQYDALLECTSDLDDICEAPADACASEESVFNECMGYEI